MIPVGHFRASALAPDQILFYRNMYSSVNQELYCTQLFLHYCKKNVNLTT